MPEIAMPNVENRNMKECTCLCAGYVERDGNGLCRVDRVCKMQGGSAQMSHAGEQV